MATSFKFIRVLGIPIYVNYTWFIVFGLVVYNLAVLYFPYLGPYYSPSTRWIMAFIASITLFASILLHELSHSYVAQRHGIKIKSITLFIFGGIAQMVGETRSPRAEMKIAAAGPALSFLISGIFWIITFIFIRDMAISPVLAVSQFLAYTNMILAIFNLIPGFPLDGGRILRAIIWARSGNLSRATLITSRIGKGFAIFLIVMGLWDILQGVFIHGLWLIFIGIFLQQAAEEGYRQTLLHRALSSVRIRDIMVYPVMMIADDMTLESVVNDYFFRYRYNSFPVISNDNLVGIISIHDIKGIEKERWPFMTVRDVMHRNISEFTISPDGGALEALDRIIEGKRGRLVVVEYGKVMGIISQRDIMQMLKLKTDLGAT